MKIKISIAILLMTLYCCKKDSQSKIQEEILGKWINQIESRDTLLITDSLIYRTHFQTNRLDHIYEYKIINSHMLELNYIGADYVGFTEPFKNKINYNNKKQILEIENFQNTYPRYAGDTFKRIK